MAQGSSSLLRALVIIAAVSVAAVVVSRRGAGGSGGRAERAMKAEMIRQGVMPALEARLEGVKDRGEAQRIGAELSRRGLARLTPTQLRVRMELLLHIDTMATEEQCAARFMGTIDPSQFQGLLAHLDNEQLERWAQFSAYGVGQELSAGTARPVAPATEEEEAEAFAQIRRPLSTPDENRFNSILQNLPMATATDKCWVALTIAKTTLAMPDPPQAQVLLTLGKVEAGL